MKGRVGGIHYYGAETRTFDSHYQHYKPNYRMLHSTTLCTLITVHVSLFHPHLLSILVSSKDSELASMHSRVRASLSQGVVSHG